ncbi:MAG: adenylyl-sulfate kinase [Polyangiales bacterium]
MASPKSQHIKWEAGGVTRAEREALHGHRGVALWFTGLSGSGKSTLAHAVERELCRRGHATYVLDGDNVRHGLSSDLGFSAADRCENVRRIGEVAKLFVDAGVAVLCAFVSPYRADRDRIRQNMPPGDFVEVHVEASLAACRQRDPKGLYGKAQTGEIADLTGVGSPYEPPEHPELVIETELQQPAESMATVLRFLETHGYIPEAGKARRS